MDRVKLYSPGPWKVGTLGPNGCPPIGTERGLMVAMCAHSVYEWDQPNEAIANASLISCAPDLLEALELFASQHKCGCEHPACNRCADDKIAESVLARAYGETK